MENLHKITRKKLDKNFTYEKGMVLLVVMLFLSIVSLLAIELLNTSLLETKMSNSYRDKVYAFYEAEKRLKRYEREIVEHGNTENAKIIDDRSVCGAVFYHVVASAKVNGAQSKLQSTFAKNIDSAYCDEPKPITKPGRQSFLVIK
jgi:Tfp pilus assembly protein PilX